MTEIEIKAHVADPAGTERIIRGFAEFRKEAVKSDTYWKIAPEKTQVSRAIPATNPARKSAGREIDTQTIAAAVATGLTFLFAIAAVVSVLSGADKKIAIYICLGGFITTTVVSWLIKRSLDGANAKREKNAPQDARGESNGTADAPVKIRIREEDGDVVVTYKKKELRGDTEVNDEREFTVNDRAAFEALVTDIGFDPYISKEKNTKSFSYRAPDGTEVTIELSLVARLGWFAELEILAENPTKEETERAQRILRATLALSGIPESAIEPKYYTDMLRELDAGKAQD
jgi:predicted adenylyl cyclase CyaB